jgi:acyl-coenzyme A thioesterase 9
MFRAAFGMARRRSRALRAEDLRAAAAARWRSGGGGGGVGGAGSATNDGGGPHHHHHHVPLAGVSSGDGEPDPFVGGYTPVTKALWRSRLTWRGSADAAGGASASAAAGPPRSVVVTLPFPRDVGLRETYANPWGFVRLGRLLEDLDSLSGTAAFAHVSAAGGGAAAAATAPPPQLVTASVDAIHLARPLRLDRDLQMSARVVWSGSSSLDVRMEVRQPEEEGDGASAPPSASSANPPSLVALFSYVALDRATRRPVRVPAFVPATDEERAWFEERRVVAEARRRQRQQAKEQQGGQQGAAGAAAPTTTTPTKDDPRAELLRRFAAAAARLDDLPALSPPRLLPVSRTRVDNALVTQPQQRNTAGRVFGGFLMRRAFELSFACSYLFAGTRPAFVRCDDVSFAQPVDVGDLMRFSARVLAAWPEQQQQPSSSSSFLVAVEVVAERARPDECSVATTNAFRYVFRCAAAADSASLRVPIPTTAEDAQRVAAMLSELPEDDVLAIRAALEAASRER